DHVAASLIAGDPCGPAIRPARAEGAAGSSRRATPRDDVLWPCSRGGVCTASGRARQTKPALLDMPLFDPEGRRILMTGRLDALQPFRQDIGVGAEIERQHRQFLDIDALQLVPEGLAFLPVELDLDP